MKKVLLSLLLLSLTLPAFPSQRVGSYYRHDGTYVKSYYRSSPNYTRMDNYSTQGNYNPYTGSYGTRNPYSNYGYGNLYGSSYNRYSRGYNRY